MSDMFFKLWDAGLIQLGIWETIYMTLISTVISYILGLPLGVVLHITEQDLIQDYVEDPAFMIGTYTSGIPTECFPCLLGLRTFERIHYHIAPGVYVYIEIPKVEYR